MLPPYRGILSALLFWSCYFSLCLSCIRCSIFCVSPSSWPFKFNFPIGSCLAVSLVLFSLQSQSLSLSASLAFPVRFSQFSPSLSVTPFMYFSSAYATRPPSSIFPFSPSFAVPSVLFPLLFLPHGLFSSILPVSLCLSALLSVLFPVPSRSHARSGLASVQNCR